MKPVFRITLRPSSHYRCALTSKVSDGVDLQFLVCRIPNVSCQLITWSGPANHRPSLGLPISSDWRFSSRPGSSVSINKTPLEILAFYRIRAFWTRTKAIYRWNHEVWWRAYKETETAIYTVSFPCHIYKINDILSLIFFVGIFFCCSSTVLAKEQGILSSPRRICGYSTIHHCIDSTMIDDNEVREAGIIPTWSLRMFLSNTHRKKTPFCWNVRKPMECFNYLTLECRPCSVFCKYCM